MKKANERHLNIFKFIFISFISVCIIAVGSVVYIGYDMYSDVTAEVSIADKISQIKSDKDYIEIEDVSENFLESIVSVEDHRFYTHSGLDYISLGRAIMNNVLYGSKTGGSTITQQLAKNMYFSFEKRYTRKIAELFVVSQLEQMLSKQEILELYINVIYFGNDYYGIKDAALGYFGTAPENLTLEQSVVLAGIPKAPSIYTKNGNKTRMLNRSKHVINTLIKNEYITQEQAVKTLKNLDYVLIV